MKNFNWKDFFKNRKNKRNKNKLREQLDQFDFDTFDADLAPSSTLTGTTADTDLDSFVPLEDPDIAQMPVADEKWDEQGFPMAFAGAHAGWLYYCDSTGNWNQWKLGNGVTVANQGDTISDAGGALIQNAVYNDGNWMDANYTVTFNGTADDITPLDVVQYCIDNPTVTNLGGHIDCSRVGTQGNVVQGGSNAEKPCGSLYVGIWDEVAPTANNHQQVIEPSAYAQGNFAPADQNGNYLADANGNYVYSPSSPQFYSQNNCNGGTGACDSSYYLFGCSEDLEGAVNYSLLQQDPGTVITDQTVNPNYDPADWTTWTWLTSGEGYSGGHLDGNNNIIGQGSVQGDWLTAFQGGTTNPVAGCDDGTGIPNNTNHSCCTYIGCNDDTTTGGNIVPVNYGVHVLGTVTGNYPLVNTQYVNQYTSGINIQTLNGGVNFGCESATTPNTPDNTNQDCCAYVGCPNDQKPSVVYDASIPVHDINDPFTWFFGNNTTPSAHPYAGTNRIVGCDTAAMIADATGQTGPTGEPDPNDTSCCWENPYSNQVVGCTDPLAANGDANNDGCIDTSLVVGDPFFGVADPNIFTCCEYNGCGDFTNQANSWDYANTSQIPYKYVNQVASLGVFDNADGTNTDPAGNILAIDTGTGHNQSNPLKATNGGTINDASCQLPNFGCPHDLATNYNATTPADGCEAVDANGVGTGLFHDYTDPAGSTVCCEFIGCPAETADNYGPFDPNTNQYGNVTTAVSNIWQFIQNTWSWINGSPKGFGCDIASPFGDLTTNNNVSCCTIEACGDPSAINYICNNPDWDNWCDAAGVQGAFSTSQNPIANKGIVTDNPSLCITGGCSDDSIVTSQVNDGNGAMVSVTHYAAANYDPNAGADCSNNVGGTDYSCCKYYGCEDWSSTPTTAAPNAYNGINPNDQNTYGNLTGTGYDGTAGECIDTNTQQPSVPPITTEQACNNAAGAGLPVTWVDSSNPIVGCPGPDYDQNEIQTDYNTAYLDSNSSWFVDGNSCCSYKGCNTEEIGVIQIGAGLVSTYNPHPYIGDNTRGPIGCEDTTDPNNPFINVNLTDCCEIEGCNQPTAINYGGPSATGCETSALGGGNVLDPNNISCCHFIGCGDEESISFGEMPTTQFPNIASNNWGTLTTPDGTVIYGYSGATLGCSANANNEVDASDNSCCIYIGCNDTNALNAGVHSNNNPDNANNQLGEILQNDPSTYTNTISSTQHYCSTDGSANGIVVGSKCCCAYKKGCTDLNATGANPQATSGIGSNDNGGCDGIVPQPDCADFIAIGYDNNEAMDIFNVPNPNFPNWGSLLATDISFEQLDPNNTSCCEYQIGCPDSGEWNPYCVNNGSGAYVQTQAGPNPGAFCQAGYMPLVPSYGWGEGFFVVGNIGCDMNGDNIPDSFVMPGGSITDPSDDFACCTYEPCDPNHCCIAYSTPPINPGGLGSISIVKPGLGGIDKVKLPDRKVGISEQADELAPADATLQVADPIQSQNPGYQSPFHPIPNHPNPQGGWGWIDLEPGHPCFCPDPYHPIDNPNGHLLVNCDDNQPVNPDHPCPLPPPAGCPPKTGHPGHFLGNVAYVLNQPGTWNPDTCSCDYETYSPIDDEKEPSFLPTHCCGDIETGEIVSYSVATGQQWPGGLQIYMVNDHCTDDLGPNWFSIPCKTTCDDPFNPPNQNQQSFECGCNVDSFPVDVLAGDLLTLQQFSGIPANTVIPAGTSIVNYNPTKVGCDIIPNHTYSHLANYDPGAPNLPVPGPNSIENLECCKPSLWESVYGCMDINADNYILGQNAYGNTYSTINPNAIGCPDAQGNPDPNNFSCCDYSTAAGCNDPIALNYDPDHLGCVPGQTLNNIPSGVPPLTGPVNYNDPSTFSCCDYSNVIGCANGTTTFTNPYTGTTHSYGNYNADHMGCDDDGDGLPDGSPFPGTLSDQCCTPPIFNDPCAGLGGAGPQACDQMETDLFNQYPNATEMQFFNFIASTYTLTAYENCCAGQRNNCGHRGYLYSNIAVVMNSSTGGNGTPAPGLGNRFPALGSYMTADYDIGIVNTCHIGMDDDFYVSGQQVGYAPMGQSPQVYRWYNGKGYGYKPSYYQYGGPSGACQYQEADIYCGGTSVAKKIVDPDGSSELKGKIDYQKVQDMPAPPAKSQEELEYERNREEFEDSKSRLLASGWIEGKINRDEFSDEELKDIEFIFLYNANGEKIDFYRKNIGTKVEPDSQEPINISPTDAPLTPVIPVEPTQPNITSTAPFTPEPTSTDTITSDELSELIKNAIEEVKLEIKNSRK